MDDFGSEDDEDSGQKASRTANEIFAQSKDIGEKYGATIVAVLLIIGLLYFWLIVLPKPLTVTVYVTGVDSNTPVNGAQVEGEYLASPFILTPVKKSRAVPVDDGKYVLRDVPSNTANIPLTVQMSPDYEDFVDSISTGDTSKTVTVKLVRNTKLQMQKAFVSGSIAPSCTKSFDVPIFNNDTENDIDVMLVSDTLPYFSSGKKTIAAGDTANVSFSITTNFPDSDRNPLFLTGDVRISGTDIKTTANITLTSKPAITLSPLEINLHVGDTQLIEIKNNGKGPITGVRISMDSSSRTLVDLGIRENEAFDLVPGQTNKAYAAAKAVGTGIISIYADCVAPQQWPVKINAD
jgi:hypothetical protein